MILGGARVGRRDDDVEIPVEAVGGKPVADKRGGRRRGDRHGNAGAVELLDESRDALAAGDLRAVAVPQDPHQAVVDFGTVFSNTPFAVVALTSVRDGERFELMEVVGCGLVAVRGENRGLGIQPHAHGAQERTVAIEDACTGSSIV